MARGGFPKPIKPAKEQSQPKIYKSLRKRPAVVDEPPTETGSIDMPHAPRSKKSKKVKGRDFEDLNNFTSIEDFDDDTPKKFLRLINGPMEAGRGRNAGNKGKGKGLNKNDEIRNKNRNENEKPNRSEKNSTASVSDIAASLKILPGEKLSDFNRRVDQALPLVKARGKSAAHADKKQKKQVLTEEQIRAKEDAEAEAAIDADTEAQRPFDRFVRAEKSIKDEDPFAHLEAKAKKPKFGEVADGPPDLRMPRKLLKNVPKSSGSMARREMLEGERDRVIQSYRALMDRKKLNGHD